MEDLDLASIITDNFDRLHIIVGDITVFIQCHCDKIIVWYFKKDPTTVFYYDGPFEQCVSIYHKEGTDFLFNYVEKHISEH